MYQVFQKSIRLKSIRFFENVSGFRYQVEFFIRLKVSEPDTFCKTWLKKNLWLKGKYQKRGHVLKRRQWSRAAKHRISISGRTPVFFKNFLASKFVLLKYLENWKWKAKEFQMYSQSQAAYCSIFVILFTGAYNK